MPFIVYLCEAKCNNNVKDEQSKAEGKNIKMKKKKLLLAMSSMSKRTASLNGILMQWQNEITCAIECFFLFRMKSQ